MSNNLIIHQKRSKKILTINSILFQDVFFATVEVIYFLKILHLSFSEFATITSLSVIVSMVLEIPTGIISDYFGRKEMLLLGTTINIIGTILMIIFPTFDSSSFIHILIAQIIIITGDALASGNFEVLIYDYITSYNISDVYFKTLSSKLFSIGAILSAIFGLISTIFFNINPYLPLIFDILIQCIKFISFIQIPKKFSNKDKFYKFKIKQSGFNSSSLYQLLKNKNHIIFVILLFSIIFAISRSTFSLYQPMMTSQNLSLVSYGFLTVVINLSVFFIVHYYKFHIEKNYIPLISILVLSLQSFLLLIPFLKNKIIILCIFIISFSIMQILRIISEGLSSFFINKEIEKEKNRTVYFSIYKTLSSLILSTYFGLSSFINHLTHNYIYTYILVISISIIILLNIYLINRRKRNE